ncbi:hypothetical protein G7054_g4080 [Neopestalotiopsis clavispora]|nr:hypothetical protein G7054_g4080 [Neopestalotiopsis clavispora]
MDAYQYSPLNKDESQIRLLTLLPAGKFTEDLQIILSHAQLSRPQPANTSHEPALVQGEALDIADHSFTALSYVWGSTENPSQVVVRGQSDDRIISVTRNLDIALRHLRSNETERVLWVDAICINQGNLAERSSQVCLMSRIYNRAREVLIWLGQEQDDGDFALSLLGTWGSKVEVDFQALTMAPAQEVVGSDTHWANPNHEETLDERESLALSRLIHREWFERLWVRQEALTATPTTVRCGNTEYSTHTLKKAIFMLYTSGILIHLPADERPKFQERWRMIYELIVSFATTLSLDKLRFGLRGLKWGDPLDAIYATLNLLTPSEPTLGIVPDYTLSPATVFQDVATRRLNRAGNLSFLASCELASKSIPELPTWVPDWSSQIETNSLYSFWSASAWIAPQASIESNNILNVTGIQKAVVRDAYALGATTDGEGTPRYAKAVEIMYSLLPENLTQAYLGGGDLCEAYTRTFTADLFADRYMEARRLSTLEEAKTFIRQLKGVSNASQISSFLDVHFVNELKTYVNTSMHLFTGRSFITTDQGYIGLAPHHARPGDSVSIIIGCKTPLVLRAVEDSDSPQWQVVGACYCPGLMFGEAIYGDSSKDLSPVQRAVDINVYELSLEDKYSDLVLNKAEQALEHFGIPVTKSEFYPEQIEVTEEALREKGIQLETLAII